MTQLALRDSPGGIPYLDLGGQGPPLHFAHANGFPPGTYQAFLTPLSSEHRVLAMECRALWGTQDPARFRRWREFAADLHRFVEEMGLRGCVGMGHSLGAVTTLFCAAAHPGIFGAVVLIDPVIVPMHLAPVMAAAIGLGLSRRFALSTRTRRRRMEFPSRELVYRAYRAAPVFARWQDGMLRDYVANVTEEDATGGVHLRYPREWEARIFETAPPDSWLAMPRLRQVPLLVIRGQDSTTYTHGTLLLMRRLLPAATFVEIEGADHFVPMSRPDETRAAIRAFLSTLR